MRRLSAVFVSVTREDETVELERTSAAAVSVPIGNGESRSLLLRIGGMAAMTVVAEPLAEERL